MGGRIVELIPIVSKEAYLAAAIHDLIHIPYSPAHSIPHALYPSSLGPLLYVAYRIERHGLWGKLFRYLVGVERLINEEIASIINELRSIDVYRWSEIETILISISERIRTLYNGVRSRVVECIERVFGFRRFFTKLFVIHGFNPTPYASYGSVLHLDDENIVIAIYVNDTHEERHALDLVIHELLHGLVRLNGVELEHDVEELIIDVSAPEGYLSKMIGLANEVRAKLEDTLRALQNPQRIEQYRQLFNSLVEYYEKRMYERINVLDWVSMRMR